MCYSKTLFLPLFLSFANSVTINGVPQSGLNPNTGFSLPNIPAAQTVVVTFEVVIVQDQEMKIF